MVANHEPSSCSALLTPPYYNRVSLLQSSLLSTLPLEIIRTIIYTRELNSVKCFGCLVYVSLIWQQNSLVCKAFLSTFATD